MGFLIRSKFAKENHDEAGKFYTMQWPANWSQRIFLAPTITDLIRNAQRELYDEKLEHALENARFGIEQRRGHQDTVQPG